MTTSTETTDQSAPSAATNADATTATPVVDANAETTAAEAGDELELDKAESGETPEQEAEQDKLQAEIDQATRRLRRRNEKLLQDRAVERAESERLRAELAKRDAGEKPTPKAEDPHEIAKTLRLVEKTAEATSKVMKEAGAKFKDFDAKVKELVDEIGPQLDQQGRPSPLMEAVLDSDKAADVLYHLGQNPEVALELSGLTPARLGRRIAQIETELAALAKPKTSAAAKPLAPVKPASVPIVDEKKLTDAQWHALRKKARLAG